MFSVYVSISPRDGFMRCSLVEELSVWQIGLVQSEQQISFAMEAIFTTITPTKRVEELYHDHNHYSTKKCNILIIVIIVVVGIIVL